MIRLLVTCCAALADPTAAFAQASAEGEEIVITGQRRSAAEGVDPLATLDQDAIAATGATTMSELLRAIGPVAQSADGGEPIFLLNAQRVSGYEDIGTLPPEAIDKVEVLPEPAALKFGFPPTRRIVNFITKRRFRQVELRNMAGTTTNVGSGMVANNFALTRLAGDSRLTVTAERRQTAAVSQDERTILPDPDVLYDAIGNVTGIGGGEIDPALSALAGRTVTVAPVPGGGTSLGDFAGGANSPRLFEFGPLRTLSPRNDALKGELVWGNRLGGRLAATVSLSGERSRDRSRAGPATATLIVPGNNPQSPFGGPVLLQRYLTEVDPLAQRQTTTKLRAGGVIRGAVSGWRWDVTGSFDQQLVDGRSERGIDLTQANAAIAGGADPFAPLDPALLEARLVDHARLRTRTVGSKAVITKGALQLPAGEVNLTATAEADRSTASSRTRGSNPFELDLARSRVQAGAAIDVPIASEREEVLPWLGELSVNASITVRRVGGAGILHDRTLGTAWTPVTGVQLLVQDKSSEAAAPLDQLSSPVVRIPNVPVFDYGTGRTEFITLIQGGNPDLVAERRQVRSASINIKPWEKRDLRLGLSFEDTTIRDQTGNVYALTPAVEAILPGRYERDGSGRLVSASFQPVNFFRQRQRTLKLTVATFGHIGAAPPEDAKDKPRPAYYAGIGPTLRLSDRLQLREGAPVLDILRGDTISGGGMARFTSYFYSGINYKGYGMTADGWYGGGNRVRSDSPTSDLRFSPIFKINMSVYSDLEPILKSDWTRKLQLKLEVANLTDSRVRVRDANGDEPRRFQADYLDPVGRTAKLSLQKLL